jgi:2,3-dihydroxybenzoate-AMP ligase
VQVRRDAELLDRGPLKDLIDRGGEKINVEEVELLVAGHPAVAEIALIGMPDPDWVSAAAPLSCPGARRIRRHSPVSALTWRLRAWPCTSGPNVELIDALPRTQVGKVSKVTLHADIGAKLEHETTPRRPAVTARPVL